ncbi:leucine-rich repeat domain-containing protein [Kitasatospora sp. NPDC057223]|uniref:leucine-rich repeat domain-containing protein n=1 Tax=Kitasatospora sp. NPDC057223 TaxID=3346055 RepID=UPI003632DBE0
MPNNAGPTAFTNRWGELTGPLGGSPVPDRDHCSCFDQRQATNRRRVRPHTEQQDTSLPGWQHLLELVDEAAADGREEFRPLAELSPQERRQVITLPPAIAGLTEVRHLVLYGSNLVRIPPEIGAMTALEEFTPYTSRRLHWYPYELTRCRRLVRSTVSTRALYGNEKIRPPFPPLSAIPGDVRRVGGGASTCSVCDRVLDGRARQVWISLRVATDVLPLLVNACSADCVKALPAAPRGYVRTAHRGGPAVVQPPAD